jgi:hypothetical protein
MSAELVAFRAALHIPQETVPENARDPPAVVVPDNLEYEPISLPVVRSGSLWYVSFTPGIYNGVTIDAHREHPEDVPAIHQYRTNGTDVGPQFITTAIPIVIRRNDSVRLFITCRWRPTVAASRAPLVNLPGCIQRVLVTHKHTLQYQYRGKNPDGSAQYSANISADGWVAKYVVSIPDGGYDPRLVLVASDAAGEPHSISLPIIDGTVELDLDTRVVSQMLTYSLPADHPDMPVDPDDISAPPPPDVYGDDKTKIIVSTYYHYRP